MNQKGKKELHKNDEITASTVRVIGAEGEQLGIFVIEKALLKAEQIGLDLVEISPNSSPPVCKIIDFGKYRFELEKKKKLNKKKQHIVQLKEIRLRPQISDHDLLTKLTKAQKFLANGAKLKFTVMFQGREMARMDVGFKLLERVSEILEDVAKIDKAPETEGRRMTQIMSPR
ncbi:MAG: translation initiation factor IF-3 [Candidatus Marinimicrobia bacterium]|nr:translation initiation factor IF-3 [Candidatus Neomarinimicrobiota bacterium]